MTIDIERLKQRCDHADAYLSSHLHLNIRTVRELIDIAERHDELVAHVERMESLLSGVIESDLSIAPEWDVEVAQWLKDKPQVSLAQLKAKWQAEEIDRIAFLVEKKATDYDEEHGYTDHSTGCREYPGDGAEYYNEMMELADEIRASGGES